MNQPQSEAQLVLAGAEGVGKSTLWHQYLEGRVPESIDQTISSKLPSGTKDIHLGGKRYILTLLDSGGREALRTWTSSYFKNRDGVIFVFDITRRETFVGGRSSIENIMEEFVYLWNGMRRKEGAVVRFILIGNKSDLNAQRAVSKEEAEEFAERYNMEAYVETCALTGKNVVEAVNQVAEQVITGKGVGKSKGKKSKSKESKDCAIQ